MRKRPTRRLRITLLALVLCVLPLFEAHAAETRDFWRPVEIGFDLVVLRPLGLTTIAIGGAFLGPALLISLPNGKTTRDEAIELFFTIPFEDVFQRELGDI